MKYNWGPFLTFWGIIAVVAVIILSSITSEVRSWSRGTYEAWCKATHSEITYKEWKRLKSAELLPGQSKSTTVVVPVYGGSR